MSLKEALQKEKDLTKEMTADMTQKQKLMYFWDYYKWPTLIGLCVVLFIIQMVVHYATLKETVMFATMVNFGATETQKEEFTKAFTDYAELDTHEYTVDINDDITLGIGMSFSTAYSGQELMVAYIGGEQLDVLCTGDNVFFDYAYEGKILALSEYMSPEEIEKYSGRLYYVDETVVEGYTKAIRDMDYDYSAEAPDPDKPEDMERPVPVGVFVDDSRWLNQCFSNKDEKAQHYVVGLISNSSRAEFSKKFIEFLAIREDGEEK